MGAGILNSSSEPSLAEGKRLMDMQIPQELTVMSSRGISFS